ncbi:MAG: SDR family oxidoreductase [Rhodocyclales bacterium GT-UBC]|nr:MAG: SDR family oxidoreductase [Rhodocyclales bacterium GT-UBC]
MSGLFDLHGQVVLVTGATGGLGMAIVEAMAAAGATVVVSDRDAVRCEESVRRLRLAGYLAHAAVCDLTLVSDLDAMVGDVIARCGKIDILVCNAGVQGLAGPIGATDDTDWEQVMGLNLKSALQLCARVIPGMAGRGSGSVILMSSIAGLRGNRAIGLYGVSKAGLAQLARNLAVEWGAQGVRVNAISPGLIRTPLAERLLADEAFMARRLALTPLRRVGEPAEVAGIAVLLASPAGAFITGQNLVVDGGTTISDGN